MKSSRPKLDIWPSLNGARLQARTVRDWFDIDPGKFRIVARWRAHILSTSGVLRLLIQAQPGKIGPRAGGAGR